MDLRNLFSRKILALGLSAFFVREPEALSQTIPINYDEAKVVPYQLPDPLRMPGLKPVTSVKDWEKQARPAILNLFQEHVYGAFPDKAKGLHFKVREEDKNALGGLATRKQVTVYLTAAPDAPTVEVLLYLPNQAKKPVPAFLGLNYFGNNCVHADPGILLSERWMRSSPTGIVNNRATEAARGMQASRWPVEDLMRKGFALVTAYYGDLEPDHETGYQTGIRTVLQEELNLAPDKWSAIGAWAWGLSRVMDYLEKEQGINAKQVALTGHSRLGKAALWAAANDTRFALVVSNDSGEGGAALARRNYGENIAQITKSFPHWFIPRYKTYSQNPANMPVDQHLLLALMAPRPLYVCSALEDRWADPMGEFLGAKHTEPVYNLYKKIGLGTAAFPPVEQPVGETVRYHIRQGGHNITAYDWQQHIAFAQKQFNYPSPK